MNSPKNTIRDILETQGNVMNFCCDDLTNQTFDILSNHKLEEKCINHPELIYDGNEQFCSDAIKSLDTIKKSFEYGRFMKLQSGVPGSDQLIRNWRSQMKKACRATELINYYTGPVYMLYFQLCQERMLYSLAKEKDEKNYDAFLRNWINNFTTLNKRIAKEFSQST
ncbi:unnamed protein product [Adineta steineri]|uniref:Uncharacterized protein n=1 Tax=Adineta steineri TaxID=433720 RepID=A0A819PLS6_9BILA|nr:unnamed protein product [Adineta steineri]CAF4015117.1 unnamed protein product [Adineta steineri]